MTLKELFQQIHTDQQKGLEQRVITLVAVAGENNRMKSNLIEWLGWDESKAYKLMSVPTKPENLIPVYASLMGGDTTEADAFCKRGVFQVVYEKTHDFMEAFSYCHVEKASFRELQALASRRVVRFEIKRIPTPATTHCYLYAEVEGEVKITGERYELDNDEKEMLLKEYGATEKGTDDYGKNC